MSELPRRIEQTIRARGLLARGQRVLVAVSGGVDSMVLLNLLHELAQRRGWKLTVAHLNHSLRGRSSDADERLVRRAAEALKLPVRVERADVRGFAGRHHLSLEMAARELRHKFLARTASRLGIPTVALAHHTDDQLELFFLRLFRGSSGQGLGGMKWCGPSPANQRIELVRPLLGQPRSALLAYASHRGVRYREDASNASLDIQRNRIRRELLPLLRASYQPALSKTILRTAEILGAEAEFCNQVALAWLRGKRKAKGAPDWPDAEAQMRMPAILDSSTAFESLPVAIQRRVVQLQVVRLGISPEFTLVEELRSCPDKPVTIGLVQPQAADSSPVKRLAMLRAMAARGVGPGRVSGVEGVQPSLTVARDGGGILHVQAPEGLGFQRGSLKLDLIGGAGETRFGGTVIRWRISRAKGRRGPTRSNGRECFDADKIGHAVVLRHWRPGDRFRPIGMAKSLKLQDFFTNEKIPAARRRQLIVAAAADGELFWVEGMRIADRFKLSKATIHRLQWSWERP